MNNQKKKRDFWKLFMYSLVLIYQITQLCQEIIKKCLDGLSRFDKSSDPKYKS